MCVFFGDLVGELVIVVFVDFYLDVGFVLEGFGDGDIGGGVLVIVEGKGDGIGCCIEGK